MKEELKKSLRTYGALLLLGVTGVPLGGRSCDRGSQSEIRWQGKRRHESDF